MKKFISLTLALIMGLSLVACGSASSSSASTAASTGSASTAEASQLEATLEYKR